MSANQEPAKPFDFQDEFLKLLDAFELEIYNSDPQSEYWEKLIRYQTLIITAGYMGLTPEAFLSLKWLDLIDKTPNQTFEISKAGLRVYYSPTLITCVDRNFKLINPPSSNNLVLHQQDNLDLPVSTTQFNMAFRKYVLRFLPSCDTFSGMALRKTFLSEIWKKLGANEKAYWQIQGVLDYKAFKHVIAFLGHDALPEREIIRLM